MLFRSTQSKLVRAQDLGLDAGILASDADRLTPALTANETQGGYDVVLDLVGGPYVAATLPAMASKGRIVVVGLLAGPRSEINLATVLARRLSVTGTVLRSRPLEEKIQAADLLRRTLSPWLARGMIAPVIEAVVPLEQAAEAHRLVASNATFGKVLLSVGGE